MAKKRDRKYIPSQHPNPVVLSKKIEKLGDEVKHHRELLDSVNKANDLHVEQLSNFVRHDLKNAILGLNSILYNAKKDNSIPEVLQKQLDTAYSMIEASLDSFTELIPSTTESYTSLPKILNAVDLLSRASLKSSNIDVKFEYDRNSVVKIYYPFQTLVQVIHNLVLNSHHALRDIIDKKILVSGNIDDGVCIIKVYDNARMIDDEEKKKIFDYGYSTTGGTGIGLFHAKQVVIEMNGSIEVLHSDLPDYTKFFIITININTQNE